MSPYGAPLLMAVVIAVVVIAVMFSLRKQSRVEAVRLGDDPAPIRLQGRGTQTSKTLAFRAGQYRVDYRFSDEWATAVSLISASTGDKDMLLYKTGSGSAQFSVESDERAIVEVEPTAEHVDWQIEIHVWRPLPSSNSIESRLP